MKNKLIVAICGVVSFEIFLKVGKLISSALWNGSNDFINAVFGISFILFTLVASVAISQKIYSKLNPLFEERKTVSKVRITQPNSKNQILAIIKSKELKKTI